MFGRGDGVVGLRVVILLLKVRVREGIESKMHRMAEAAHCRKVEFDRS
jgi:hypothetical protein